MSNAACHDVQRASPPSDRSTLATELPSSYSVPPTASTITSANADSLDIDQNVAHDDYLANPEATSANRPSQSRPSHLPAVGRRPVAMEHHGQQARSTSSTHLNTCSGTNRSASSLSGPFDIFIYGDKPDRPPPSRDPSGAARKIGITPQAASTALPEHLIALPPLSNTTLLGRPSTPQRNVTHPAIDSEPGTAERAAYRSWREGKAVLGGRVMYSGETNGAGQDDKMPIDKKIEATLPRAEQKENARSRKTTHHMGVFSQDNDHNLIQTKIETGPVEDASTNASKLVCPVQKGSKSPPHTELVGPCDDNSAELRSPNISADGGTAVSESGAQGSQSPSSGSIDCDAAAPVPAIHDIRSHSKDDLQPSSQLSADPIDEEEIDGEHISSAVYYPHRNLDSQVSPIGEGDFDSTDWSSQRQQDQITHAQHDLEASHAHYEAPSGDFQIAIQAHDENHLLQGHVSQRKVASVAARHDQTRFKAPKTEAATESEYSASELDDDLDPGVATPRAGHPNITRSRPAPPQAIALTPFSHQVGGHTAVYRFSRRAVCKELNNKENKFYETVENHHPELLRYMPKYIGVLNVTFQMTKRRRTTIGTEGKPQEGSAQRQLNGEGHRPADETRIVSHNQQVGPMPEVYFDMNRHIIPKHLFPPSRQSLSEGLEIPGHGGPASMSDTHSNGNGLSVRPAPQHHNSWGATRVNQRLREQVMREAFSRPSIHKFKRRGSMRSKKYASTERRPSTSEANVSTAAPNGNCVDHAENSAAQAEKGLREHVLQGKLKPLRIPEAKNGDLGDGSSLARSASTAEHSTPFAHLSVEDTGTSSDIDLPPKRSGLRAVRRRHSGSGLRRMPENVDSKERGDLQYFEGTDDPRVDEEVFPMDHDNEAQPASNGTPSEDSSRSGSMQQIVASGVTIPQADADISALQSRPLPPQSESTDVPMNPKEARTEAGQRIKEYLLMEDLTSGLTKPCTLDLKMGTRQYGIDANETKQESQRSKCGSTTSRRLGVRVCGMQTYNVTTKKTSWRDKYYGRDLKAGKEFREALLSFFFDGIDHNAALHYIPIALKKITSLEDMVRTLPGYRFYGSSLYVIYDGGVESTSTNGSSTSDSVKSGTIAGSDHSESTETGIQKQGEGQKPALLLKIIDFANCVTAETTNLEGVACPPSQPEGIDKGYLRGLRSLKRYFRRILCDLEREKVEGEMTDVEDDDDADVDEGDVSN